MVDRRDLRELVEAPEILVMPETFNGFGEASLKPAAISDAKHSESLPGWADPGVHTFDDNPRACRALADRAGIQLLVPDLRLPFGELNALMSANQFGSTEHKLTTS